MQLLEELRELTAIKILRAAQASIMIMERWNLLYCLYEMGKAEATMFLIPIGLLPVYAPSLV